MKSLGKKIWAAILALAIVVTILPAQNVQASESIRINVNQTITKSLDKDTYAMYSFKAPKNGYFTVELTMTEREGANWHYSTLTVLDASGNQILGTIGNEKLGFTCTTDMYAAKAGTTFYIKLASDSWLDSTSKFKVVYKNSENWENETNNSAKEACGLKNKKYKYGIITQNDKYDYYKMKVNKPSTVKVTFGPKDITGNNGDWNVAIISSNNDSAYVLTNVKAVEKKTVYLKKGTYYLRVEGPSWGENKAYKLKYQLSGGAISKPVISKATVKKYSDSSTRYLDSITFSKNGYVDGYKVQVAKKKSMAGKYINQKIEKRFFENKVSQKRIRYSEITSNKNLNSKKATYYVRVRGYVLDPFGNEIYGKYSKIKKVVK